MLCRRLPGAALARLLLLRPVLLVLVVVLMAAAASAESSAARAPIAASRTTRPPIIDGTVDDPVWARAAPFTAFVDFFPREGGLPSEATELRVLYDDDNLYFGFRCRDSRPLDIVSKLGVRDAPPVSDTVEVSIDVAHDRRTAYLFGVNAGGVQYDRLLYSDNQTSAEWDAVWDARVAVGADGWSAEIAVPLRLFRLSSADAIQRWGFVAQRHLARTHEDMASVLLPRQSTGYVSLFGDLVGVADLRPRHKLELLPYLASRVVVRPPASDPRAARLADPSLDVGMDVRAVISRLQLNGTVNPDFGQVESDQLILNLTNQEVVFPEKRPFFFQGTEIFQPVSAGHGIDGNQVLFYSRRIGLDTPILGAAKLTGELGPRVNLGLVDAFVAAPAAPLDRDLADRRLRFPPERPLHYGPDDEALSATAASENFFAGVLTTKVGDTSTVGVRAASAVPFPGPCRPVLDGSGKPLPLPAACAVTGGNAGAVDWSLRTADAAWVVQGQAEASEVVGGPPSRTLPDGVVLARGGTGFGTYVQAGKVGGAPFRFDVNYAHISPTLDLNGAGFLPTQNRQDLIGEVRYVLPTGFGALHSFDATLNDHQAWSTDGRDVNRGHNVTFNSNAVLPGFHKVGIDTGCELSYFDIREITGRGIPFQRIGLCYFAVSGETDPARALSATASAARDWTMATAATPGRPGYTLQLGLLLRLQSRLESRLNVTVNHEPLGPRWIEEPAAGDRLLFGDLQSGYLSATFRQQLVIAPRLVGQAYAQLFTAYGHYSSFFAATAIDERPIGFADLRPIAATADGFYQAGLRINLVLRWEYRLGSTFFAVYNHARERLSGPGPATLAPVELGEQHGVDTFLVKWSYFWPL